MSDYTVRRKCKDYSLTLELLLNFFCFSGVGAGRFFVYSDFLSEDSDLTQFGYSFSRINIIDARFPIYLQQVTNRKQTRKL